MDNQRKRCPFCEKPMDTKRKDAQQCRNCRRKQQKTSSKEINVRKRKFLSLQKSKTRAEKTGADKEIEDDLLNNLEVCLEESNYPTKEDFKFLMDQIIYDFEARDLPENIQDEHFTKLRETKFKNIFNRIKENEDNSKNY